MQSASDPHGMCRPIEEVGIAKSDMVHTLRYLCANILQHNLGWNCEETSLVDWRNGAMETGMLAATRCFGIPCK